MAENGKNRFRPRWRTLFLLVVLAVVGWSVYSYWSEYREQAALKARELMAPAVGSQCTIILRKAELGISSSHLAPVEIDGVSNHVQGEFVQLNDEWIVLRATDNQQLWIPRDHLLLMRVEF